MAGKGMPSFSSNGLRLTVKRPRVSSLDRAAPAAILRGISGVNRSVGS